MPESDSTKPVTGRSVPDIALRRSLCAKIMIIAQPAFLKCRLSHGQRAAAARYPFRPSGRQASLQNCFISRRMLATTLRNLREAPGQSATFSSNCTILLRLIATSINPRICAGNGAFLCTRFGMSLSNVKKASLRSFLELNCSAIDETRVGSDPSSVFIGSSDTKISCHGDGSGKNSRNDIAKSVSHFT